MMHTFLLGPGGFVAGAGLPLTDRGFRYGMSVFETIAIHRSAPLLLDAHLAKLGESAAAAGFRPPAHWQAAALLRPPIAEGVARIYITAGDRDGEPSRVAMIFEETTIPTELGRRDATTMEFTPALPFGKTGNYWPHLLAGRDAILCRPDGALLGGSMSNVFLVIDGEILTPRVPIRRGVVRDWIGAAESDLTRHDLTRAASAFLTNSRLGICALASIDGKPLGIDPLVESLWQRYRAEVLRAD